MITDYASLQSAINTWLGRGGEVVFASSVPTFIQLGEQELMRKLRVREMVCIARADLNEDAEWLPDGFQEIDHVNILDIKDGTLETGTIQEITPCRYLDNAEFYRYQYNTQENTQRPQFFTIIGEQIFFRPYPNVEAGENSGYGFELVYYGEWAPLSDAAPTNRVLTKFPQLYLWASLIGAEGFVMNDERMPTWRSQLADGIMAANLDSERSTYGTVAVGMPR